MIKMFIKMNEEKIKKSERYSLDKIYWSITEERR